MKTRLGQESLFPSETYERATLLFSIHNQYVELILKGKKDVELRRRFGPHGSGCRMLIYATQPIAAVVGHTQIENVERLPIAQLWSRYGKRASITKADFMRYFDGVDEGCAILLTHPTRYAAPIRLDEMRSTHGLNAPQSYIVLREAHRDLIDHEQG